MKVVVIHKSKSTLQQHLIYGEPKSGSLADLILLTQYYRENDMDHIIENMSWQIKLYYHFNFLLKEQLKNNGNLICSYCGKEHLVIQPVGMHVQKNIMATVDHFKAKIKGGLHFDENNMVVSCYSCNSKKGSKDYDVSTLKYMDTERLALFTKLYSNINNKTK